MADDTDALFGLILFILFLALLGYAAGGMSSSSSSAGTTSRTYPSLPPLSGSSVASCTGTQATLRQDEWDTPTSPTLNLKVYENPMDAGQKCATASTNTSGTVKVTLAYSADASQMVSNTGNQTASVQVNGTDDYCVSAAAEIVGTSTRVTIPKVVEPCMMTVPATRTTKPWPTVRADDLEDEEGY
jgi:hypothetical protein